jgi:hypothetical protein
VHTHTHTHKTTVQFNLTNIYTRGRQTGVNYHKWGKNEILGGNEDSVETEQEFYALMNIKTKQRNRFDPTDSIQIALTSKYPNFDVIVSKMKHHHFSKI